MNVERVRELMEWLPKRKNPSSLVSVVFNKADGTERQLTFNPLHSAPVKGTGKKMGEEAAQRIWKVTDIKIKEWRSFDARRVIRFRVDGEIITD